MARSKAKPPASIEQKALQVLRRRLKTRNLLVVGRDEDRVPSTGAPLYRFHGAKRDEPNGPHDSVVLDEDHRTVDLARLSRREKVELFKPDFSAVLTAKPTTTEAITIAPKVNKLVLKECKTFDEVVTVTVPKDVGVSKVDVYFLADTTGSMGTIIDAVKGGASAILNAPQWAGRDIAFGVGQYKDFPSDPFAFQHQLNPDTTPANADAAIGTWSASGGGDGSEGQLFALDQLAQPAGGSIGWRPGSKRIIVWFGDAPGHDPICQAISGSSYDITEVSVTGKLVAEDITVIALSTVTGFANGLDDDPTTNAGNYSGTCAVGGASGQATRITAATNGLHVVGINAGNIVTQIIDLIDSIVNTINNLRLVASGATAPFVTSIRPAGGYGPLAGDEKHVLRFKVRFTGIRPCSKTAQRFKGSLDVVADGVVEARKRVSIKVPACRYSYSVKYICGTQEDCECCEGPVRPGTYATEINIHNYHDSCRARVKKFVLPLVQCGAATGREPRRVDRQARDRIVLPPNTATLDDCHRIFELLHGTKPPCRPALMIGFLEIVSDRELQVTAVYTATGSDGGCPSIDVEQIEGKLK